MKKHCCRLRENVNYGIIVICNLFNRGGNDRLFGFRDRGAWVMKILTLQGLGFVSEGKSGDFQIVPQA